jgi:hypothetical protein
MINKFLFTKSIFPTLSILKRPFRLHVKTASMLTFIKHNLILEAGRRASAKKTNIRTAAEPDDAPIDNGLDEVLIFDSDENLSELEDDVPWPVDEDDF